MRTISLFLVTTALAGACGDDGHAGTDAAGSGDAPAADAATAPPRIIGGGGIADGPITGTAHVYVIDDATRLPVAGATVTVGTTTGVTDATGLFTATGVTGKQTVVVTAATYRTEMWIGANGQNLTVDVHPAIPATPASAKLTATVDVSSFPAVVTGHLKAVVATYSQDERATDAANNLAQGGTNICTVSPAALTQSCSVHVLSRTGHVALAAAIFDDDPNNGNSVTLLGWATKTGLVVAAGSDQTGLALTPVAAADTITERVDFNSPPASLPLVAGVIGVELGSDGVLDLPALVDPSPPELLVPQLSVFGGGATYRLTGVAKSGSGADAEDSATIVRAQTGTSLTPPAWLTPPATATVTRTHATWSSVSGAVIQSIVIASGTSELLNVTSFDGTTTMDFPAAAGLPATGTLAAEISAIGGTIDVTSFGIDADRDKLTGATSLPTQVAD